MKEYTRSIVITFLAGFAIAVLPEIDSLTLDSFQNGALVGLMFAGVRTGIKMVLEGFMSWYSK